MRGGAQAHLVAASDGQCYVVKFAQNPQGHRVLVNELICSVLMKTLEIATPEIALVTVGPEFVRQNPDCWIGRAEEKISIQPGTHFGSRHPDAAGASSIFDFLPSAYLSRVYNRDHFLGALVVDKWVSNADARQAIFYRAAVTSNGESRGTHWVAVMIDNGHAFQKNDWTFADSAIQGIYSRCSVYGEAISEKDVEPWLHAVSRIATRRLMNELYEIVPTDWIAGEEHGLKRLLARLCERSKELPELLRPTIVEINHRLNPLPFAVHACGPVKIGLEPIALSSRIRQFLQPIAMSWTC